MYSNKDGLKFVLNQIRNDLNVTENTAHGSEALSARGDENGTLFEKYIENLLTSNEGGFTLISLDKNKKGWSELQLTTARLKDYLATGQYDMVTKHFKLTGRNNIFIQQSDNPPDVILYIDGVVYYIEAKKTTKNSITYGDNLPKPDYIYILRDTKNKVQTVYFGDDIISKEDRDETYRIRDEWKQALAKVNEEYTRKLPTKLWGFHTRSGFSSTIGGLYTMPSASPYREQREGRVLNYIDTGIKDKEPTKTKEVKEGIWAWCVEGKNTDEQ